MKTRNKRALSAGLFFIIAFILWTVTVRFFDVKPIGPNGSSVGLATLNGCFSNLIAVNMMLYTITDWLSIIPLILCMVFAVSGLIEWIRVKKISLVNRELIILGGYFLLVILIYLFFESVVINYRPVLIDGYLEASYPSSTTMLVMCVMPASSIHINLFVKKPKVRLLIVTAFSFFTAFMVLGRLISGVHWISDIIGGTLLSAGLLMLYYSAILLFCQKPLK